MSLGIRRCLDDFGRVTIPKGMRKSLNINEGDLVDISCLNGKVIIKPVNILDSNKINRFKDIIKNTFDNSIYLYILNSYKVLYSPFEDEIGNTYKFILFENPKEEIKKCKFMHIENIGLENNFIGHIYLYSEKEIDENTTNISKLLAYALSV